MIYAHGSDGAEALPFLSSERHHRGELAFAMNGLGPIALKGATFATNTTRYDIEVGGGRTLYGHLEIDNADVQVPIPAVAHTSAIDGEGMVGVVVTEASISQPSISAN